MRVLIIRHAVAEELPEGGDDAARALTAGGRKKMRAGAAGLTKVVAKIDVLASSPLVRAVQTAEIVSRAYDGPPVTRVGALQSGKPVNAVLHWLQGQGPEQTIAIVGHEPQLGLFVSWALSGQRQRSFVRLRKGSACLIEFDRAVKAGAGALQWMLKPSQMRDLAD